MSDFNQPAKLAERMLAPGDGKAEPGVNCPHPSQPTKWATDEPCKKQSGLFITKTPRTFCRPLRRLF